jgi:tellurite methyltransferase
VTDRERWDARHASGPSAPSAFVTGVVDLLPKQGRALDLAGGTGRNGVVLARHGLDVTVADVSPVGLGHARAAGLATLELDLTQDVPAGPWDVILVCHFLDRAVWAQLPGLMAPGGWLALCHPTRTNLRRNAQPSERFLLEDREIYRLFPGLDPVLLAEGWFADGGNERHEARIVARRP